MAYLQANSANVLTGSGQIRVTGIQKHWLEVDAAEREKLKAKADELRAQIAVLQQQLYALEPPVALIEFDGRAGQFPPLPLPMPLVYRHR